MITKNTNTRIVKPKFTGFTLNLGFVGLNFDKPIFQHTNRKNQINNAHYYLSSLFKDINDPTFEHTINETTVWNNINNSFCLGHPVDRVITDILNSDVIETYQYDVLLFLKFFLAKLRYKQGRNTDGNRILYEIKQDYNKISAKTKQRLSVLVEARELIENPNKNSNENYLKKLHAIIDKIEHLCETSSDYTIYQKASAYGKGIGNLYSHDIELNSLDKNEIKSIVSDCSTLYSSNKKILANQEVVVISLNWFILLYELKDSILSKDDLSYFVKEGFSKSSHRKNSLFYIQTLIVLILIQSIESKANGIDIFVLIAVTGKLMWKFNISEHHEGVNQLLLFLKAFDSHIYKFTISAIRKPSKISYKGLNVNDDDVANIIRKVDHLWNIFELSNEHIYNVNIHNEM